MLHALKLIVVISSCHFAAYYVLARLTPYGDKLRQYFIGSVIIIAVASLTGSVFLAFLAVAGVCYKYAKGASEGDQVALFFGLAFTLTYSDGMEISGALGVGALSHVKVLILVLFVPLFFKRKPQGKFYRFNAIDKAVIYFFIWSLILTLRDANITTIIRVGVWWFVMSVVPYIVIRRYISDYLLVFTAISFALFSQALIGMLEALMSWHIYTDIERTVAYDYPVNAMYKFRWGYLRAQASFMNPLIFVLFANMGFLCAVIHYLRIGMPAGKNYAWYIPWAAISFGILGSIATGSRSGIAGSVFIVLIMLALKQATKLKKDPKGKFVTILAIAFILMFSLGTDFMRDNFGYRWKLIEVSIPIIKEEFLFGLTTPSEDPRMETLRQGEGIVDLVNTYVATALLYGLPGFFLFVYAIFGGINRLYNTLREAEGEMQTFGLFCCASLVILAFNLATTSSFNWSATWIWLLLAASSNIVARVSVDNKNKTRVD